MYVQVEGLHFSGFVGWELVVYILAAESPSLREGLSEAPVLVLWTCSGS